MEDFIVKKLKKPMLFMLLALVIIIIGDDETRDFLKKTAKRIRNRNGKNV